MANNERFPTQENCDMDVPEEHILWPFSAVPYGDKVTQPVQSNIGKVFSKHLVELGYVHGPWLAAQADENGYIHVDQIPKQTKKLLMPYRGQQHPLNPSAIWVDMDIEAPEPPVLPNVRAMTRHEQELMVSELEDLGLIQPPQRNLGKVAEIRKFSEIKSKHVRKASDLGG
jgi:hypothetical protein